ncbi:MAG TPA: dihydroneopterin aldolase [Chthoniobacterales bacterium]|jgi:phosphoglycolate phosphatase
MIKNVILDWSGTVVDDLGPVVQATNAVFAEFALPSITLEEFRAEFCLPMEPFYERRMPAHSMDVINEAYHRHFVPFAEAVGPLPNSRRFLEFCQQTGRRLFILSTISPGHFEQQAAKFGFTDFFEHAYVGIPDKRKKIGEILRDHRLQAHETLFAGDMVHDVETAHHAGVLAVALLSGFDDGAKLAIAGPDVIVRDLGDLQTLMETSEGPGLIRIDGLQIDASVGVPDEEIARPQRLLLDVEIRPRANFSNMADNVENTVDYFAVCESVRSLAGMGKWRLIETLAADVRKHIFSFPNVASVKVKVRKFILPYTEQVSVEE